MPSFAIHCICGNELLKRLNVSDNDKKTFMISNVLPDVSRVRSFMKMDDKNKRKAIQYQKKETHFRIKTGKVLEYPSCDRFLDKYKDLVMNDITTLGYFFHLYCDYYYFKYYIKENICFLDEQYNENDDKDKCKYVKINKNNNIIPCSLFFSKNDSNSIYKEYSKCDSNILSKYNLVIDTNDLIEYIDDKGFDIEIEETNSLYAYYAIHKIDKYVNKCSKNTYELKVFDNNELLKLPSTIINSFINEYGYLLDKYML